MSRSPFDQYPVRPHLMATVCRRLAADMRREHAMGMDPITLTCEGRNGSTVPRISRLEAALSMDRQAERWEEECRTGVRCAPHRRLIGA